MIHLVVKTADSIIQQLINRQYLTIADRLSEALGGGTVTFSFAVLSNQVTDAIFLVKVLGPNETPIRNVLYHLLGKVPDLRRLSLNMSLELAEGTQLIIHRPSCLE